MTYFQTAAQLKDLVEKYFDIISSKPIPEEQDAQLAGENKTQTADELFAAKPGDPALLTALALSLGFTSLADFEAYERSGAHKKILKTARLRVELHYERRLLQQAPTGAMFALRCMGWTDKQTPDNKTTVRNLGISISAAGPKLAKSEKEVEI